MAGRCRLLRWKDNGWCCVAGEELSSQSDVLNISLKTSAKRWAYVISTCGVFLMSAVYTSAKSSEKGEAALMEGSVDEIKGSIKGVELIWQPHTYWHGHSCFCNAWLPATCLRACYSCWGAFQGSTWRFDFVPIQAAFRLARAELYTSPDTTLDKALAPTASLSLSPQHDVMIYGESGDAYSPLLGSFCFSYVSL